MPAVTVDDLLTLPRVAEPAPDAAERGVRSVTTAPSGLEGEGFPVRRAFAGVDLARARSLHHLDQMGEVEYAPGEPKGTPWHPHRGFETVTYMIDGIFEHQDSNGGGGVITNGDTQWMTAGGGILHIEKPPETLVVSGGLFHGFQLWVNLPAKDKLMPPRYQDVRSSNVTLLTSSDGGALIRRDRRRAGRAPRTRRHAHADHDDPRDRAPRRAAPPAVARDFNALAYVLNGLGTFGPDAAAGPDGPARRLGAGDAITVTADGARRAGRPNLDVLILGGRPIGEPVAWAGPFVMNTKEEVLQAFEDFQKGSFGHIPG